VNPSRPDMVVPPVALVIAPWFRRRGASRPTTPRDTAPTFVCARIPYSGDTAELASRLAISLEGAFSDAPTFDRSPSVEQGDAARRDDETANDDQLYRDVDSAVWVEYSAAAATDVQSTTGVDAIVLYVGTELSRGAMDAYARTCSDTGLFSDFSKPIAVAVIKWQYEVMPDGLARSRTTPAFRDLMVAASRGASDLLFWSCHVDRMTLHQMCKANARGDGGSEHPLERLRVMGEGANISAQGTYKAPQAHFPGRLKSSLPGGGTITIEEDETPFGIARFHSAFPRVRDVVIESFASDTGVQTWQGESVQAFAKDPKNLLDAEEKKRLKELPYNEAGETCDEELAIVFGARKRELDAAAASGGSALRSLGVASAVIALPHLTTPKFRRIADGMWTLRDLTLTTTTHVANPLCLVATDEGLAALAGLPHLRRLVLRDLPGIRGTGFSAIAANAVPLEELEIAVDAPRGSPALLHPRSYLNDDGAEAISELAHLRSLTLVNPVHLTDAGLATLACAASLHELSISGAAEITGEGFRAFAGSEELEMPPSPLHTVVLSDEPIAGFAPNDLPKCIGRLSNAGLSALAEVPKLASLSLCAVGDLSGGVDVLVDRAKALRQLALSDATTAHSLTCGFARSGIASGTITRVELRVSEADRSSAPRLPVTRQMLAQRFPAADILITPPYALAE